MEQESMITMMPPAPEEAAHSYKTLRLVIGIIVAAAIVTGTIWLIIRQTTLSPKERLEQLEEYSRPVVIPPAIQFNELENLSEQSKPVTTTEQEQLDMLNMITNQQ